MRASRAIVSRAHPLWLAYVLHRVSGLCLALFLPVHFWVLSLAMTDPARLDGFLVLTGAGIVKLAEFGLVFLLAEFGLVFLLAVHLSGGLRLMAMEWLPWSGPQKTLAAAAAGASFLVAVLFFMQAV